MKFTTVYFCIRECVLRSFWSSRVYPMVDDLHIWQSGVFSLADISCLYFTGSCRGWAFSCYVGRKALSCLNFLLALSCCACLYLFGSLNWSWWAIRSLARSTSQAAVEDIMEICDETFQKRWSCWTHIYTIYFSPFDQLRFSFSRIFGICSDFLGKVADSRRLRYLVCQFFIRSFFIERCKCCLLDWCFSRLSFVMIFQVCDVPLADATPTRDSVL